MAKVIISGFDTLIDELNDIADHSETICKKALYKGAGLMADQLKTSIDGLATEDQRKTRSRKLLPYEKEALQKGLSIFKFEHDKSRDYVQTSITFKGRVPHLTERYPTGLPVIVLARSINSGTTFRRANRYFPTTVRKNAQAVEKEMADTTERELKKFIK